MELNRDLRRAISAIKTYMEIERDAGLDEILLPSLSLSVGVSSKSGKGLKERLANLEIETALCKGCQLYRSRNNLVFGVGSEGADLMFIGEAPGRDEDLQGIPFVGRAGQLLTKIIEAMGLKRSDVYIANILKCRPPNNRDPLPTEILACEENLLRQIEVISPKVIVALGKFAAQTLLRTQTSISKMRGHFYNYHEIRLMPTFHPAYLLRNPGDKRLVWDDMKKVMKELGIPLKK